jgi:hypothetical protein
MVTVRVSFLLSPSTPPLRILLSAAAYRLTLFPLLSLSRSVGQAAEIFQSGVIPADTDYRIFRDFGEIPGIDMAFYQNGYGAGQPLRTDSRESTLSVTHSHPTHSLS